MVRTAACWVATVLAIVASVTASVAEDEAVERVQEKARRLFSVDRIASKLSPESAKRARAAIEHAQGELRSAFHAEEGATRHQRDESNRKVRDALRHQSRERLLSLEPAFDRALGSARTSRPDSRPPREARDARIVTSFVYGGQFQIVGPDTVLLTPPYSARLSITPGDVEAVPVEGLSNVISGTDPLTGFISCTAFDDSVLLLHPGDRDFRGFVFEFTAWRAGHLHASATFTDLDWSAPPCAERSGAGVYISSVVDLAGSPEAENVTTLAIRDADSIEELAWPPPPELLHQIAGTEVPVVLAAGDSVQVIVGLEAIVGRDALASASGILSSVTISIQ